MRIQLNINTNCSIDPSNLHKLCICAHNLNQQQEHDCQTLRVLAIETGIRLPFVHIKQLRQQPQLPIVCKAWHNQSTHTYTNTHMRV